MIPQVCAARQVYTKKKQRLTDATLVRVYVVHVCGASPLVVHNTLSPQDHGNTTKNFFNIPFVSSEDAYILLFQAGTNETLFLKNDSSALMSHEPYEEALTNTTSTNTTALNATSECEFS